MDLFARFLAAVLLVWSLEQATRLFSTYLKPSVQGCVSLSVAILLQVSKQEAQKRNKARTLWILANRYKVFDFVGIHPAADLKEFVLCGRR